MFLCHKKLHYRVPCFSKVFGCVVNRVLILTQFDFFLKAGISRSLKLDQLSSHLVEDPENLAL